MSDKITKEQLNEILRQKTEGGKLIEKALPLRKPPVSMTQQNQSNASNSDTTSSSNNASATINSTNSSTDKKE
jgi:hypothetical protein